MLPGMGGPYGHPYGGMGLPPMFPGAGYGTAFPGSIGSAAESLAAAANEKARAFLPPSSSSLYPSLDSASPASVAASKLTDSVAQRAAELSSSYPYPSPATAGGLSTLLPSAAAAHSAHASAMAAAASLHASQHLPGLSAAAAQYPGLPPSYMPPSAASQHDIHRPVAYVVVKPEDHYRSHVPGAVM